MTFAAHPAETFHELALGKMTAVLGAERARRLMEDTLSTMNIRLRSADDLFAFATHLSRVGGFEGAVGAMLCVRAVMSGASGAVAA